MLLHPDKTNNGFFIFKHANKSQRQTTSQRGGIAVEKLLQELAEVNVKLDALYPCDPKDADKNLAESKILDAKRIELEKQIEASQVQADAKASRNASAALLTAKAKSQSDAEEAALKAAAKAGRATDATTVLGTSTKVGGHLVLVATERDKRALTGGYGSLSMMARDVLNSRTGRVSDNLAFMLDYERTQMAATGMGEAVGSDGAFLIPIEFANKIMERVYADAGLLQKTDIYTVGGNSITFPRNNETSRVNGSRWGGVTSYWLSEGSQITGSKPGLGRLTLNLGKLALFGALTDELMSDAQGVAADQYMGRCFSNELNFRVSDALVNGLGSGQPVGMVNAPCKVKVAKETGQAAATVSATNVVKMWSRMWAPCRANAAWYVNQDVEPQLQVMTIGTGVANWPVYLPAGGFNNAPYATLFGRPVLPLEQCQTLGTEGDIILADLSQWATAVKAGGPQMAASIHFYFDTDQQALRLTIRLDSQPWWMAALTPANGTNTLSCVVTLATR